MSGTPDPTPFIEERYRIGLERIEQRAYFEAHEALEDAWRAASAHERDFFRGLVHVAVAWYQAARGNEVGCLRQLEKATRRLGPYAGVHRGLDITDLLEQLETARTRYPDLPQPRLRLARPR